MYSANFSNNPVSGEYTNGGYIPNGYISEHYYPSNLQSTNHDANQYCSNYQANTNYPNYYHQNTNYGVPTTQNYPNYQAQLNTINAQNYLNYQERTNYEVPTSVLNMQNHHQRTNYEAQNGSLNTQNYPNYQEKTNYEAQTYSTGESNTDVQDYQEKINYESQSHQKPQFEQQDANYNCNQVMPKAISQIEQTIEPQISLNDSLTDLLDLDTVNLLYNTVNIQQLEQLDKDPHTLNDIVGEYSTEKSLIAGNDMLNQSEIFYCTTCNISFTKSIYLERHFNAEKHKKAVIKNSAVLAGEIPTLHEQSTYIVQPIKTAIVNSIEQYSIEISLDQSSELKCIPCNRVFTKACYLSQHNEAIHIKDNNKPYKCHLCPKQYSSKKTYERHLLVHISDKRFKCDQCPIEFKFRADLVRHMYRHGGTKPHSCEICGKYFIRRDQMRMHAKSHDGFPCGVCGKTFYRKSQMIKHSETH